MQQAFDSNQDTTATIQNEGDAVEVIYFHGKQRCATCNAIEREAQQLVDSAFLKNWLMENCSI